MKTFKEQLKEESGILFHNFVMILSILTGSHLLLHALNLIGNILGALLIGYGAWLLVTAIQKGVDELLKEHFPHLLKQIENLKNKKGE